jgi:cell division protein FtsW (lipid II flippase)
MTTAIATILLLVFAFVFFFFGARGFWLTGEQPTNWRLVSAGLACWLAAYFLENIGPLTAGLKT